MHSSQGALPHLPAEPRRRSAAACPSSSASGCCACCATTASRTSSARPSWSRRCSGSSWPSSAPRPRSRWPRRCSAAGSTSRRRPGRWPARRAALLERLGRATQLRFPVVGDLARSVRFRWFDQPPVDAERADVLAGGARRGRPPWPPTAASATTPSGSRRWPRSPSRSCGSSPSGSRAASRPRSRCWRCWSGGTTASSTCTTCSTIENGRPVRRRRLHPRRPADAGGVHGRHHGRARGPAPATSPSAVSTPPRRARAAATRPSSTSTCTGPRRPSRPTSRASGSGRWSARCPSPATYAGSRSPSAPAASDRSATSRSGPTSEGGVAEDDLTRGVHPMVGRRLNLWRLRNFDVTRIEAPEDVLLYECVAKENPADRRLVALAQVRQLAVVRDDDGNVTSLPHAERAVENCLEAIRRARVARGAAGTKLDMNHVWVQVWPVVDVDISALSALGNKIRPLTDGAGIEEVVAQGRVATPRRAGAGRRTVQRPARRGRRLLGGPAADRAAQAARRLRRQGAARAPPRAGLPLRAGVGARRPGRHAGRARPRRQGRAGARSTGRAASTRPASSPPSSPRRPRCTPRA